MDTSRIVAGLDEVGMGCLAGPLVICVAAYAESTAKIAGVRDSKKCSAKQRITLLPTLVERAAFVGVGYASARTINKVGIATAWQIAAEMALADAPNLSLLIVDGNRSVDNYRGRQKVQPKADATFWQVSAASIVAKVLRDREMEYLGSFYKDYKWEQNSGYGTPDHCEQIKKRGATQFHRTKWIRKLL